MRDLNEYSETMLSLDLGFQIEIRLIIEINNKAKAQILINNLINNDKVLKTFKSISKLFFYVLMIFDIVRNIFNIQLLHITYPMGNSQYKQIKQTTLKNREESLLLQSQQINKLAEQLKIDIVRSFQIANLTIPEIVQKLNDGTLTSEEVLTALALRTIKIARQFNLITYLYFRKGLILARKCDEERRSTKKKNITIKDMANIKDIQQYQNFLPPLYGIPISIKDVYHFQGREATIGLINRANKQHEQSILIYCFRNSGMIPFVQTNVPQLGMATESGNFLWGRSLNPWNKKRAVGGSSGGQGAIISARCSVLGVGSDIGGSIRIPSDHNGVFGLKPNSSRISNSYHASLSKDFEAFAKTIPNSLGPLAKSAEDLALFMSVVTNQKFYKGQQDPYTKIVPFNSRVYIQTKSSKKKLKIGYIKSLKDLQPSAASQRAIDEVLQILKNQGHELVQIQIPNEREVIREFISQYMSCSGENYKRMLAGQPYVKQYRSLFLLAQLRAPGRFLVSTIAKFLMPRTYTYFLEKQPLKKPIDYQEHIGQIQLLRSQWIKYWREQSLDFVISPGFGCQAFPHEKSEKIGIAAAYTFIWNVLDMAVGAMPVTVVRQQQQQYKSKFKDILTTDLKQVGKNSVGLPAGVQIVGLPYNQQRVLGIMSFLQHKINFYKKYGAPQIQA